MTFDCPICHTSKAITASWSVSGGTYWEPPEHDLHTSQSCACALSDEQWDTIAELAADNPDDDDLSDNHDERLTERRFEPTWR